MKRNIRSMPVISGYRAWPRGRPAPHPFVSENASFWYSARVAIWQGVRRLGLNRGERVLVPAYSCGSEVDALLKAELKVDYYRVGPDLNPDYDHLRKLCRHPARALLLIHYFGVPQSMNAALEF